MYSTGIYMYVQGMHIIINDSIHWTQLVSLLLLICFIMTKTIENPFITTPHIWWHLSTLQVRSGCNYRWQQSVSLDTGTSKIDVRSVAAPGLILDNVHILDIYPWCQWIVLWSLTATVGNLARKACSFTMAIRHHRTIDIMGKYRYLEYGH